MKPIPARPNILLIITHDSGRHLGCYGAGVETPALDGLAAAGVRFDNAFCTAPQCSPSRGSLLTGKVPHRNGLVGLAHIGWELDPGQETLPRCLGRGGYETVLFGFQHESADPGSLGYNRVVASRPATPDGACDNGAAAVTAAFLAELPALQAESRPFYACLGFTEAHRPFPDPDPNEPPPKTPLKPLPWLPDRPGIRADTAALNGLVREVDRNVARLLQGLEAAGLRERTLVIFTTDHGLAMPRAKGTCYDPGVGVALIMNWAGTLPPQTFDRLVSNVDLLPTLCDVAQVTGPAGIDGTSVLPALLDPAVAAVRTHLFLECTWHDRYNPIRAVRTDRYKYIRNFGKRPLVYLPKDIWCSRAGADMRAEYYGCNRPAEELYDLNADPWEYRNVVDLPQYDMTARELRGRLQAWMTATDDRLLHGDWPPTPAQHARDSADPIPN